MKNRWHDLKDNTAKFFDKSKRDRQKRVLKDEKRQAALQRARELYEAFKTSMMAEGCRADEVIERFDAFKAILKKEIKDKELVRTIIGELHWAQIKFMAQFGPRKSYPDGARGPQKKEGN